MEQNNEIEKKLEAIYTNYVDYEFGQNARDAIKESFNLGVQMSADNAEVLFEDGQHSKWRIDNNSKISIFKESILKLKL